MEYLIVIPFIISFYFLIMILSGKLKLKDKIDDASVGSSDSNGGSTLCDSSGFDCEFGGDGS